jgi:dienelactone hydrolase
MAASPLTMSRILTVILLLVVCHGTGQSAPPTAPPPTPPPNRPAPPPGITLPDSERRELADLAADLERQIAPLREQPAHEKSIPDVEIFRHAVQSALDHDEFFDLKEVAAAKALLREGALRAKALASGQTPWNTATGLLVRGYRSRIDHSVQPYGLVIPADWTPQDPTPRPLYCWFHGRNEKLTEIAFLTGRMKSPGEFTPPGAFVLHLYGRFCNASKFAGETDFFEALADTRARYPVDPKRLVIAGFSMGGASTWHLATHHAWKWAAAAPGAGFAETAQYAQVFSEGKEPPPWWEQKLWRMYDATVCAENLFNTSLIAYSGELDGQKQAADIMEKALAAEGLKLEHLIGPQTAHRYEPATKQELARRLEEIVARGRPSFPAKVRFTTYTLRYHKMDWVEIDAMEKHWERGRIEADLLEEGAFRVQTRNVAAFTLALEDLPEAFKKNASAKVTIDSQEISAAIGAAPRQVHFRKTAGKWALAGARDEVPLAKRHGLTGPIDDAFTESFIFVKPTGKPLHGKTAAWCQSELDRAIEQWRTVFRGNARVKEDTALSAEDIASSHLVLWGDPASNAVLTKILPRLPLQWTSEKITLGKLSVPAATHAPVMIYPNPLNPNKYVVLNSSFTFRRGSSQTNSQQTPKLPDWALIDLQTPPGPTAPGGVVDAGFFGENWELP